MDVKNDFPMFKENKKLVYLDSAATTQKPQCVIDSLREYYVTDNANPGRALYDLSENAKQKYEGARGRVAEFIGADVGEVVFTKGTTESINILCHRILPLLPEGRNEIVLTEMEHHSNLVPWQQFAKAHNFKIKFIPVTSEFMLDYNVLEDLITDKTALVCVTHVSNVLGTVNDIKRIISLADDVGALSVIDAAQSVAHIALDVKDLNCDFLAFSGHKMYGPMGIGVLYGKGEHLEKMDPLLFGGGMVMDATFTDVTFVDSPGKFEAGTQNVAGAIGLGRAIEFIMEKGLLGVRDELTSYALDSLRNVGVTVYSPEAKDNAGVISFNVDSVHPHDVASILNEEGIAIRAGNHCAIPLIKKLGVDATCRISFGVYNTKEDVDKLIDGIQKVMEVFKK